jgi:hypothetical protein
MAKKSSGAGSAGTPLPAELGDGTPGGAQGTTRPTTKLNPSVFHDIAALTVMEILYEQFARKLT